MTQANLTSSIIIPERNAFAIDAYNSSGLNLRVGGGHLMASGIAAWQAVQPTTVALADNATNFVEVSPQGVISANTTSFTAGVSTLFKVVTVSGLITELQDWRGNPNVSGVTAPVVLVQTTPKVGTTAGWVVGAANNLGKMATLPASQTSSTLVVPITGLKIGDTITGFSLAGSIQSAGNAATITADLRSLTAAAAGATDASVGAMAAPLSVTANTVLSAANAGKTGLTSVVAAGVSYYVLITSTTAASTTEELQAVNVTITPA